MESSHIRLSSVKGQLIGDGNFIGRRDDSNSESCSSASSFSDSYSDSSNMANWERYVNKNGTLFYAEYSLSSRRHYEGKIEFSRNSLLSMGGKHATHKQQTKEKSKTINKEYKRKLVNIRKRRSEDQQKQQQQKHLDLVITAADRYRFGRRSTAVESMLGFRVVPFSDHPECLMVDGFVHDMPAIQQQHQNQLPPIKRGDWFKSLDDTEVHTSNVDHLLLQFIEPTKVCLKFKVPSVDSYSEQPNVGIQIGTNEHDISCGSSNIHRIENFGMFAELFEKTYKPSSRNVEHGDMAKLPTGQPFLLLILPPECYQTGQHKDSLFYFPQTGNSNFIYKSRGSFLTLNAVLGADMQTKAFSSQLMVENVQYFINFRMLNNFLVLFGYAAAYMNFIESNIRSNELISYMQFALPNLSLEHLANGNDVAISLRQFLDHFCKIQQTRIFAKQQLREIDASHVKNSHSFHLRQCYFEELLPNTRLLPLPKEAQLRIFDALSEMEAMDYRNWNDEPLNTHREFFIHGSVLYFDNFLLVTQLPLKMRTQVDSFLRCRGIFDFISDNCVNELYAWEEIVSPENDSVSENCRFFLTVCSRSHLILAVILKIFESPDLTPNAVIQPSLFYIEEIQETLDHLISCGIESLAMFWSISNKRPESLDTIETLNEDCVSNEKVESFLKQKIALSATSSFISQSQRSISYEEETHYLCSSLGGSSIQSFNQSEEDSERKELIVTNNDNISDSGSDWDHFGEQSLLQFGVDTENQNQITELLWKEINNVLPVKLSAGWKNAIFHYVYLDGSNETVFCPLRPTLSVKQSVNNINSNNSADMQSFLSELRKACLIIHGVLQKSKLFRRDRSLEPRSNKITNPVNNRIMGFAIKEHGLRIKACGALRSCIEPDHVTPNGPFNSSFMVVGRLFQMPSREIYVCHRLDAPQNLVELAFRLSFFSVG